MRRLVPLVIRPWMLPLIVAALAVPIVGGFIVAGPPLGLAVGALATCGAARGRRPGPSSTSRSRSGVPRRPLPAAGRRRPSPLDDPALVERIAEIAERRARGCSAASSAPQVLVARPGAALDRSTAGPRTSADAREAAAACSRSRSRRSPPPGSTPAGGSATPTRCRRSPTSSASFPAREVCSSPARPRRRRGRGGRPPPRPPGQRELLRALDSPKRPTSSRVVGDRALPGEPLARPRRPRARSSASRPGSAIRSIAAARPRTLGPVGRDPGLRPPAAPAAERGARCRRRGSPRSSAGRRW